MALERTYLSARDRRGLWARRGVVLAGLVLVVLVCVVFDRLVWGVFDALPGDKALYEEKGWYQVARQAGYLPLWVLVAVLVYLVDRGRAVDARVWPARPRHHRAGLIVLGAGASGLAAEALKWLVGRSRPFASEGGGTVLGEGFWRWAGLMEGAAEPNGLGMPSSHAAVAFGGAVMLGLLVRPWRGVLVGLAVACAVSRLMAGAHSFSDVVAGGLLGSGIAWWLYAKGQGVRRGHGGGIV